MCEGSASIAVDRDGVEGACGGHEVLLVGLLTRPRSDRSRSCERVTGSTRAYRGGPGVARRVGRDPGRLRVSRGRPSSNVRIDSCLPLYLSRRHKIITSAFERKIKNVWE